MTSSKSYNRGRIHNNYKKNSKINECGKIIMKFVGDGKEVSRKELVKKINSEMTVV
jgi:hypothetical protein